MAISRDVLSPLFGMGPYDYGIMRFRYPMEASNDLIGYTFFTAVIYLIDRVRQAQQHELDAAELQTKLAKAQLENLRLQIHPHFLFNTLNTISSVMYEDLAAADAMLAKLSDMLRLTLCAPNTSEVALVEELKLTRLYLDLMCRRYEERLQVTYDIDASLDESLVPQLILQPLVENSLRHGFDEGRSNMSICIAAHRDNGQVRMKVSDTGAGLRGLEASSVLNRGIGLTSVRERLAQLYGEGQQFSIVENAEGGVDVSFSVPFHCAQPVA
jgi:LytS/YehU family sensor histidine kinase